MNFDWPELDPATIHWGLTPQDLRQLLDRLRELAQSPGWIITADLETTGLNEYGERARISCLAMTLAAENNPHETENWLLPLSHPEGPWFSCWREVLKEVALLLVPLRIQNQNCLAGSTPVLTRHGWRPIEQLAGRRPELWDGSQWARSYVRSYGLQQLQRIELAPKGRRSNVRRYVYATPDHRWPISRKYYRSIQQETGRWNGIVEWRREVVTDLRVGDVVDMVDEAPRDLEGEVLEGFRHGMFFGDGSHQKQLKNGLHTHNMRLCGSKAEFLPYFEKYTYPASYGGEPMIYLTSSHNLKHLPSSDASREYLYGFILGWMVTDGTRNGNVEKRVISTTNREAYDWLLSQPDLGGWIVVGSTEGWNNGGGFGGGPIQFWTITVQLASEMSEQRFRGWTVKSIEPAGTQEVYCANVPTTNLFGLGYGIMSGNCRFDARWIMMATGVDLSQSIWWDTGLGFHLLDENQTSSLKPRASQMFGIEPWNEAANFSEIEMAQRKDPHFYRPWTPVLSERIPLADLGLYAVMDTYLAWAACHTQRTLMGLTVQGAEQLDAEYTEDRQMLRLGRFADGIGTSMIRTITDMEQRGWLLDQDLTREKLAEAEGLADEGYARLEGMLPGCPEDWESDYPSPRSYEPTSLWFRYWTEQMIAQNQLHMLATSARTGRPSWSKAVLIRLARQGSVAAELVLEYRRVTKQAQFLRSWLDHVGPDSRIRATYSYDIVRTGRTSCRDPNMQQCGKELRPMFIASPGHVLIEGDLSQVEMRIIAHVADCKPMIEAFCSGVDLHRLMAAQITGKAMEDITVDERQHAKATNFGLGFGMGPEGLRDYADVTYDVVMTEEEAQVAYEAYFTMWEGLRDWHVRVSHTVSKEGFVTSPLGRIRRLPGWRDQDDYGRGRLERQGINSAVQSMASDILQMGAAKILREVPQFGLLGMVHDSVIGEVPIEWAEQTAADVLRCMTDLDAELGELDIALKVPLDADVRISRRWGQGVPLGEWKYDG